MWISKDLSDNLLRVAKLRATKSEKVSIFGNFDFWREASLRAFSFLMHWSYVFSIHESLKSAFFLYWPRHKTRFYKLDKVLANSADPFYTENLKILREKTEDWKDDAIFFVKTLAANMADAVDKTDDNNSQELFVDSDDYDPEVIKDEITKMKLSQSQGSLSDIDEVCEWSLSFFIFLGNQKISKSEKIRMAGT